MKPNYITNNKTYKPRYSNDDGLGNGTSGSGIFDLIGQGITSLENIAVGIWGKSDKYRAQALETINEQQRRTTTILWVVIGLMVALGAFIIIKKQLSHE